MLNDPKRKRITTNTEGKKIKPAKSGLLLHYPNLCRGCGICELACSLYHERECSPNLSRIHIIRDTIELNWSADLCRQCDWPDCYFSCPVDAIKIHTKTGSRYIEESMCTGCGLCTKACPLMPREIIIRAKKVDSRLKYFKCDLCKDRKKGPVCIEYCPRNSLSFIQASER